MATEKTKLLGKSTDYSSTGSLRVEQKSKECIVVLPKTYEADQNDG